MSAEIASGDLRGRAHVHVRPAIIATGTLPILITARKANKEQLKQFKRVYPKREEKAS